MSLRAPEMIKHWQLDRIREDGGVEGCIATLDRQLQQLVTEHRASGRR